MKKQGSDFGDFVREVAQTAASRALRVAAGCRPGRLAPMVARTLAHLTGRDITVCFIPRRLMRPREEAGLAPRPVTRLPIPPEPTAGERGAPAGDAVAQQTMAALRAVGVLDDLVVTAEGVVVYPAGTAAAA